MTESPSGPIRWDLVRTRLPNTAQELLSEIEQACARAPDDPARAIERALRARIAGLTARFESLSGDGS